MYIARRTRLRNSLVRRKHGLLLGECGRLAFRVHFRQVLQTNAVEGHSFRLLEPLVRDEKVDEADRGDQQEGTRRPERVQVDQLK